MSLKSLGIFTSTNHVIDLKEIRSIGKGILKKGELKDNISYSLDDVKYFKSSVLIDGVNFDFDNLVCRYLKAEEDITIELFQGCGFIGHKNDDWTDLFKTEQGWMGGDGLFTYNTLGSRKPVVDNKPCKTLCVFGDTFINTLGKDGSRLEPLMMPNNSYALIDGYKPLKGSISFHYNQDEKGHCQAYLKPSINLSLADSGTMASNLVQYDSSKIKDNYLSCYNPPKDIEIVFSFQKEYRLSFIDIFNYFIDSKMDLNYQNRGINKLSIYIAEGSEYIFVKEVSLSKADFALKGLNTTRVDLPVTTSKVKFVISNKIGEGNHGGSDGHEALFGLNKVYFFLDENRNLTDVKAEANYEFAKYQTKSWFWLQDGLVLDNKFYTFPLVVESDASQPDGFQFKVKGISMISADIKDGVPDFKSSIQKSTQLMRKDGTKEYLFGCGVLDNSPQAGNPNGDNYIYIYGYVSDSKMEAENGKSLVVARAKKEDFTNLDEWTFYNGKEFTHSLIGAKGVLNHVSCELSVFSQEDYYIAIFTYDVRSRYIAYSLSKTPYGPFNDIRVCYVCPENDCSCEYMYNAKGHQHLSKNGNILVSYNVNTSSMWENLSLGKVYGPRFINLIKEGGNYES